MPEQNQAQAQQWFIQGQAAQQRGDHSAAIGLFDNAITLHSSYSYYYYCKASSHCSLGNYSQAITSLNACIGMDQTLHRAIPGSYYDLRAWATSRLGGVNAVNALIDNDNAISAEPHNPFYRHRKGLALKDLGRLIEAKDYFQTAYNMAADIDPNKAIYWNDYQQTQALCPRPAPTIAVTAPLRQATVAPPVPVARAGAGSSSYTSYAEPAKEEWEKVNWNQWVDYSVISRAIGATTGQVAYQYDGTGDEYGCKKTGYSNEVIDDVGHYMKGKGTFSGGKSQSLSGLMGKILEYGNEGRETGFKHLRRICRSQGIDSAHVEKWIDHNMTRNPVRQSREGCVIA